MKTTKDYLIDLQNEYERLSNILQKENRLNLEGSLNIDTRGKSPVYNHIIYKNNKKISNYITKSDLSFAKLLAQHSYNNKLESKINKILNAIRKLNSLYEEHAIDEIYNNLSLERQKLVTPIKPTWKQIVALWENQEYKNNTYENNTNIYTKKNEIVKSKSERLIADILYEMDIPYKYEYPVKLKDGRTVYPDFIILTRNRNQILFEHFGMMDNSDYANDAIDKIYRYAEMGFIQGKNIIYTFETSTNPLNQSTIYRIVNEFFK
ncbi:MAG: hypothetical protein Q4B23_04830 [Helcococcus sp.]|nr:hypothetical protein [Helcococcus sp.]